MMEEHIRRGGKRDIPRILDLLGQVLMVHHRGRPDLFKPNATKYTERELEGILENEKTPVFVYTDEKGVVQGYAFCVEQQHPDDNILTDIKTLYIDDICVDEEARGRQIGKKLYTYVKEFAREKGFYNITLNVWELNEGARKFYETCGLHVQKTGMEQILG